MKIKEKVLNDLGSAFKGCQKSGYRFSCFENTLSIINLSDKKHSIVDSDGKVINLGRKTINIIFDGDGLIR
jgi:hypothetical protein